MNHYYGWNYSQDTLTQSWSASRHGVTMCTNSEAGIKRMIEIKNYQMSEWRKNGWG